LRFDEVLVWIGLFCLLFFNIAQKDHIKQVELDRARLQVQVVELDKQLKDIQEQQQYILKVSQDISKRAGVQW
jgi:hypothetical protein